MPADKNPHLAGTGQLLSSPPGPGASNSPLKIAFCLPDQNWLEAVSSRDLTEAAFIQQGYIAAELQKLGHDLTFMAPADLRTIVCGEDASQLRPAPRSWSASPWFEGLASLSWRLQQGLGIPYLNVFSNYRHFDAYLRCLPGHDIVHERNSIYNAAAAMAASRLAIPYVMFFDADQIMELEFMGRPLTGLLLRRARQILRYNLRTAARVICVSEPAKTNLIESWGVPANKIAVFPNGVDVRRFHPDPAARAAVRGSLAVGERPLTIFVGNFYEWHDVDSLLRAFANVLDEHEEARLVLVGDGPQRPAMCRLAAELQIEHAAHFVGLLPHSQIPDYLAAADIAVAPVPKMEKELWLSPMKLYEYMAAGNAVIASAVGQIGDVIRHNGNGLLTQPGSVPELARALGRLVEKPEERQMLGRQARQDAVTHYSWQQYSQRLEKLYQDVTAEQSTIKR